MVKLVLFLLLVLFCLPKVGLSTEVNSTLKKLDDQHFVISMSLPTGVSIQGLEYSLIGPVSDPDWKLLWQMHAGMKIENDRGHKLDTLTQAEFRQFLLAALAQIKQQTPGHLDGINIDLGLIREVYQDVITSLVNDNSVDVDRLMPGKDRLLMQKAYAVLKKNAYLTQLCSDLTHYELRCKYQGAMDPFSYRRDYVGQRWHEVRAELEQALHPDIWFGLTLEPLK